jgi:hypothetical protein
VYEPSPVIAYSTTTLPGTGSTPYTVTGTPSTSGGAVPVEVFTPVRYNLFTTTLPPGQTGYTITIAASGSVPGTIVVGTPGPNAGTVTSVTTLPLGESGYTSTVPQSGSVPGYVIIGTPAARLTTSFTTLPPGNAGYTSTISGVVVIGTPAPSTFTSFITLPSNGAGYTSTVPASGSVPGTVIIGTPAANTAFVTSFATLAPGDTGYTSTIPPFGSAPGTVIVGTPGVSSDLATSFTTLPAGSAGYTSTISGVVVIGTPASSLATSFTTLPAGSAGYTSTISGVVVIGTPAPSLATSFTTLPAGSAGYTSTISGVVVIGTPAPSTFTSFTTLPTGDAGYTSTISASGSVAGTVIIGTPALRVITSFVTLLPGATGYTSTIPAFGTVPGTVIIGTPATNTAFVTSVATLAPGDAGYTSTILPSGTFPGTVIIGSPAIITNSATSFTNPTTSFTTLPPGEAGYTSTISGTVIIGTPGVSSDLATSFTTLPPGDAGYTSTVSGTVIIGTPSASSDLATSLTTLPPGDAGYTSTVLGTVIIGTPGVSSDLATSFTTLPPGDAGYTSTVSGTVIVGTPGPETGFVSSTTVLAPGQPGFTSTIAPSGSVSGTIIVGTPGPETGLVSTTTTLEPGQSAFTSTVRPSGSVSGTVIVGTPLPSAGYITTTVPYTGTTAISGTVTRTSQQASGTVPGIVVVETCTTRTGSYITDPIDNQAVTDVYQCQSACLDNADCQTFEFGRYNGDDNCWLFDLNLVDVQINPPTDSQNWTFYNPNCPISGDASSSVGYITTTVPYTGTTSIPGVITSTSQQPSGTSPGIVVVETCTTRTGSYITTPIEGENVADVVQCQAACSDVATCQTFEFGRQNSNGDGYNCWLFDLNVADIQIEPPTDSQSWTFYNPKCPISRPCNNLYGSYSTTPFQAQLVSDVQTCQYGCLNNPTCLTYEYGRVNPGDGGGDGANCWYFNLAIDDVVINAATASSNWTFADPYCPTPNDGNTASTAGSSTSTTTLIPGQTGYTSSVSGTVVVGVTAPYSYVTTTQTYIGTTSISGTITRTAVQPSGTTPGLVVVDVCATIQGSYSTTPIQGLLVNNVQACQAACASNTACLSYEYGVVNDGDGYNCWQFDLPLTQVSINPPTADQNWTFFNVDCPISGDQTFTSYLPTTAYATATAVGTGTVTYTITGTPATSGGTVPVTVYTPPATTIFSTTTTPYGGSTLSTSTGTPTVAGGTVPVTVFTPPPAGACYFAPGTCNTGSLRLRYYNNPLAGANSFGAPEGVLGPDYYLGTTPRGIGSINTLNLAAVNPPTGQAAIQVGGRNYYTNYQQNIGGISVDPNNFTLVATGYFVPQTSGTYQFCDLYADNRDDFYIGSTTAFPCGDPSDASTPRNAGVTLENWFGTSTGRPICVNINMVAGYSYPLRNVFGNNGVPYQNTFQVSGPGLGTNVTSLSGFISPDSCTLST